MRQPVNIPGARRLNPSSNCSPVVIFSDPAAREGPDGPGKCLGQAIATILVTEDNRGGHHPTVSQLYHLNVRKGHLRKLERHPFVISFPHRSKGLQTNPGVAGS